MNILRIAFGWSGRIDRRTYFVTTVLLFVVEVVSYAMLIRAVAFASSQAATPALILWLLVRTWTSLALDAKRLRDIGGPVALAFLPIGVIALPALTFAPRLLAAIDAKNAASLLVVFLLGGGVLYLIFRVVSIGMKLVLMFPVSSPSGSGERLTLFAAGGSDAPRHDAPRHDAPEAVPARGLEVALNAALEQRRMVPAPALAGAGRPSGLPQRPKGGGFGRRR